MECALQINYAINTSTLIICALFTYIMNTFFR